MEPGKKLIVQLSRPAISTIKKQNGLIVPDEKIFHLPEKVLQFGTGVLLRGLPDYFIDKANRQGVFNGRVVVVKSTSAGGTDEFAKQDNLYTLCIRGVDNGVKTDEAIINASISRVISAREDWSSILACAHNPEMKIIISNTTEVGITLTQDDIRLFPPLSFPGKLLSFLYERYKAFAGKRGSGMVIIPTELITDNGTKLKSIVIELARMNKLGPAFISWLDVENEFCNSLVDRIVPGKTENKFDYQDDLMILAESFRLWAIESSKEEVKDILSFHKVDEGLIIADDIEKFRELKLRLLNGTHSFSCALAHLAGFRITREAWTDPDLSPCLQYLMQQEIITAITDGKISYQEAWDFSVKTIDRFRNPYLEHQWLSIAVQYSSKMKMRNVPLIEKYYQKAKHVPEMMALGFAAFILFMKDCPAQDDQAAYFTKKWKEHGPENIVESILSDESLWGTDLSRFDGFAETVTLHLLSIMRNGMMPVVRRMQINKIVAG